MAPIIWKPNPSPYFLYRNHIKREAEKDAAGSRPVDPQLNLEFVGELRGGTKEGKGRHSKTRRAENGFSGFSKGSAVLVTCSTRVFHDLK